MGPENWKPALVWMATHVWSVVSKLSAWQGRLGPIDCCAMTLEDVKVWVPSQQSEAEAWHLAPWTVKLLSKPLIEYVMTPTAFAPWGSFNDASKDVMSSVDCVLHMLSWGNTSFQSPSRMNMYVYSLYVNIYTHMHWCLHVCTYVSTM